MNKDDIINLIITTIFSIIASCIVSIITTKIQLNKNMKREKMDNYYAKFHSIWDDIHRGCAYNFSNLKKEDQERIINFFIETDKYQDKKVRNLVYELKTNHLNDFNNQSDRNIKDCDEAYNKLTEIIIEQYHKKIN